MADMYQERNSLIIEAREAAMTHRQKEAKEYQCTRLCLIPVRFSINLLLIVLLLFTEISHRYAQYLSYFTSSNWILIALYFLGFSIAYSTLLLPLNLYVGYVVEHRFNLSNQSLGSWLWDYAKGLFVALVIGLPLIEIIYYLLRVHPDIWWIIAGVVLIMFSVLLSNLAPLLIYPLFYKFKLLEDEHLTQRLLNLTKRADTKVCGVYEVNLSVKTKTAEAALMGVGNTRRIVLGDTLLKNYTPSEMEVVFAHELGHHKNRHIPKLILSQGILTIVALYLAHTIFSWGLSYFGLGVISNIANLPFLVFFLSLFALLSLPLSNGYSRKLEVEADKYALEMTEQPDAYIEAMKKMADQNLSDMYPHPLIEFILYDHPSIGKRVKLAQEFKPGALK